jgi:CheY-like chemotaxis protein
LPGLDGFEVARRLRADPRGRSVTLIALTGYGQSETRARARDAGFDAFLVKPLAADDLERILTAVH